MHITLNCDMGEGLDNDRLLLPYLQAANIACGYHAGDTGTMKRTIQACLEWNIAIGAHPSFDDREHFGRREMKLEPFELHELVTRQLSLFRDICDSCGARMRHVKPHGALYNLSARDPETAAVIADAVKAFDETLVLFGLSGSHSVSEAVKRGLRTAREAFADRTYQDDGSLTPRSQPGALHTDPKAVVKQVLQLVSDHTVCTLSGKTIDCMADTICLHGDGPHALAFARALHEALADEP